LSSKIPIGYIDIRAFAHATEDVEKVLNAVRNVLPKEVIDTVSFEKSNLTGHHGNMITLLKARIKERHASQAVFENLASSLNMVDKEQLSREVARHVEKGSLYLRFDKQSAYLGELRFSSADSIHFRIQFRRHGQEEILEICRRFGLFP
jgi:RNA binding exosome subunit